MAMNKKNVAFLMAVILLFTILLSYAFIMEQVHHDCTGEGCTICSNLEMAVQTISGLKVMPLLPFFMAVLCVFTQIYAINKESDCVKNTLITLKVELLN